MRPSSRTIFFLSLIGIAASGAIALWYATPQGLGLSDDSIAYIAGARSMLQGRGYREIWLASSQPVTHLPPGYPAALAVLGRLLALDPLRGTRLLNLALIGVSTTVMGILGWQMTTGRAAGVILAALLAANASLFRLHADALSEPLFILLSLLSFLVFARHAHNSISAGGPAARRFGWVHTRSLLWPAVCGALVGAAYLTRYAGLALVLTFLLAFPLVHRGWRPILVNAAAFLAGALPLIGAWSLRNRLLGGSATNRALGWHPVTPENLEMARYNLADFLLPIDAGRRWLLRSDWLLEALLLLLAAVLGVWLVRRVLAGAGRQSEASGEPISLVVGLFSVAYIGSVLVAMTFFDASTKFAPRILAPIFVSTLVLFVAAGNRLLSAGGRMLRPLVTLIAGGALAVSVYATREAAVQLHRGGQGYASFKWYDSEAMAYLRGLPAETRIYTNEPAAVYLYTDRGCYVLPSGFDPATGQARPGFEQGVAELQAAALSGQAVLALFDDRNLSPGEAEALTSGLTLVHESNGDNVYGAEPDQAAQ